MSHFICGEDRHQATLFPELLDDYVGEGSIIRLIDVYVDQLDLAKLGFQRVIPSSTGRPAYCPAILLKIYLYGYFNAIQSSRKLERETQRNIEIKVLVVR